MNGKRLLCGLLCLVLLVGLLPAALAAEIPSGVNITAYKTKYTLTFQTNGGTAVRPIIAEKGKNVYLFPYSSTQEGYTFDGWYSDAALTNRITDVVIDKDKTIYAAWIPGIPDNGSFFTDVPLDAWYTEDVRYVYSQNIMRGTTTTTFSPDVALTRAMLITILHRTVGSPSTSKQCPYSDVVEGFYGEVPITWAYTVGIVLPSEDGCFGPNDGVTREDMANILYRYAEMCGLNPDGSGMILQEFADYNQVSDYAVSALTWAVQNGLIKGMADTTLNPQGVVSRAQGAAILHRMTLLISGQFQ